MPNAERQMPNAYDLIANWYAENLQTGSPIHAVAMPALMELAGDVSGQQVCDLACGTGTAARALATAGAEVTGIDISEQMLDEARQYHKPEVPDIRYLHGDIRRMPGVADQTFDGAVCSLGLMDVDDLDSCLAEVRRILRPGGWFVFTITHPCFQGPESRWTGKAGGTVKREVRGYFREGHWRSSDPNGVRGQVGAFHRTSSTYFNALVACGFSIEEVCEPQPLDEIAARVPGYAEVPVVLAVRCRMPTATRS